MLAGIGFIEGRAARGAAGDRDLRLPFRRSRAGGVGYRSGEAAGPCRRDRPGACRQGGRRRGRDVAGGDDRVGTGRSPQQLALRIVDRNRDDAARATGQRGAFADAGMAGAGTHVFRLAAAAFGTDRGRVGCAVQPGADRPLFERL